MTTGNWFRRIFGSKKPDVIDVSIALKTSTENISRILALARDSAQVEKITDVVQRIEQIWPDAKTKNLVRVMLMIKETYIHLEQMANSELLSEAWLAGWSEALKAANDSAEKVVKAREASDRFFDEWEKNQ